MTELTVLMPCLNEERSLAFCIAEARAYIESRGIEAEILIADNGSTDRSREIAVQNGARVITVEERGYGAALLGGIREARGKYVVMGDADGSYDFSSLDRFLAALREGNALVMGNRFRGGIERALCPLFTTSACPRSPSLHGSASAPLWGISTAACVPLTARRRSRWICTAKAWNSQRK